jgi:WD40 repeat protein
VRIIAYKATGNDRGLKLLRVFKPHKVRVNDVHYSPKGDMLVTCSEDSTLFFLNVINDYSPIGTSTLFPSLKSKVLLH